MEENNINRKIIENSYYLINLYNTKRKDNPDKKLSITNLKLQKLMYFAEAYYMVKNPNEDNLFDENWSAWDYGPVCKELYDKYKSFGSAEVYISKDEIDQGENLPKENKEYLKKTFEIFGELSAFNLVTLTHMIGSPWNEIYEYNKDMHEYDFKKINDSLIPKEKTRKWFEDVFKFIFEDEEEDK